METNFKNLILKLKASLGSLINRRSAGDEVIVYVMKPLLLSFLLATTNLFAQDFTASVNRNRVGVGEQFQITFSVNTNINTFKAPNFNDFQIYSGPNQSTNMSFVNGAMSQSISYSYIVAAKHEGKITIGAATATAGGKTLQTKPITIEVVKGNTQAQQNQQNRQQNNRQQQGGGNNNVSTEDMGDKLFIRAVTSKSKVYEGEQLTVIYKVYTRVNIMDNGVTKVPVYNGFYNEDIGDGKRQAELHNENIDGVNYQVAEIKKTLLIPQRSGTLEIDPLEMDIVTRVKSNKRSNDPFDAFFNGGFFGGGVQDVKVHVKSKTVKVEVMPLPSAGKPADFNGAVGDFSIQTKLKPDNQKMKTNDAGNLTYTIAGRGNLKLLDAFKINWPADIEGYDAKTIDHIQASANGLNGSRTFDYVFIPRHSGKFDLPAQNFSFFDPNKAKYVTLATPNFNLDIEKGAGGESAVSATQTGGNQEDVKVLGNDIKYIKTATTFKKIDDEFYGSNAYMLLMVLPAAAFGGVLFNKKRNEKLGADVIGFKMRQATKIANLRLKSANTFLQSQDYSNFYKEVLSAMYGYLGDKFALPIAQLNKDNINNLLISKGVELPVVAKLNEVLNNCEFAQYAPVKNVAAMQTDYNSAVEIIMSVEEKMKG